MHNNEYEDLKSFIENTDMEKINIDTDKIDYSVEQIKFLPVVPIPDKIICVGLNYQQHVQEVERKPTEEPVILYE